MLKVFIEKVFYTSFKKFRVVENSFPVVAKLNKINTKKKVKSISTFDFTTPYTAIPHNLLIKVLSEVIDFVFKSKAPSRISFSETSVYWTSNGCGRRYFTSQTLIDVISFLFTKTFFTIGNLVFKHKMDIPMDIDPAPYWANLFLYFFELKYVEQLISEGSPCACL